MYSDKNFAIEIKAGNLDVFQEFYQLYFNRLLNYASLFVAQADVAEDIVQEAFFKLWSNRQKIDTKQSITGLLYRTIRNQCLNIIKEKKVHEKFIEFASHYEDIESLYKADFDLPVQDKDDFYVFSEIKKAIEELPEKQRKVYKLAKFEGQSHKEIAEQVNISPKGVERHITLANKTLRTKLDHVKTAIFVLALLP
jgi:RNA polymerase sigma-70 factor (ECF subfamily)